MTHITTLKDIYIYIFCEENNLNNFGNCFTLLKLARGSFNTKRLKMYLKSKDKNNPKHFNKTFLRGKRISENKKERGKRRRTTWNLSIHILYALLPLMGLLLIREKYRISFVHPSSYFFANISV